MLLFYRLYDWQTMNRKDIRDILKAQAPNTQLEFEHRTKEVVVQFAEQVSMQPVVFIVAVAAVVIVVLVGLSAHTLLILKLWP
jgi:hypothetical protein